MLYAKIQNLLTGDVIQVHATTESPDSSYGLPAWVDDENNSYGQVQFGAPFGFALVETWEDEDSSEDSRREHEEAWNSRAERLHSRDMGFLNG